MRGGEVSVERRRRNESEMKADFRGSQSRFKRERKRGLPPAPKAIVREKSPFSPTCASAFGAAALVRAFASLQRARLGLPLCGVGSCFAFPQRRLRGLPSVALVRAFAFPQRARLGLPPPRPMGLARELSPMRPLIGVARPLACPFGATALRSATLAIARLSIGRGSRAVVCSSCR